METKGSGWGRRGASTHLARQEVHLGDSGCVPVQACKFHSRCTVAEGDWSRTETCTTGQETAAQEMQRLSPSLGLFQWVLLQTCLSRGPFSEKSFSPPRPKYSQAHSVGSMQPLQVRYCCRTFMSSSVKWANDFCGRPSENKNLSSIHGPNLVHSLGSVPSQHPVCLYLAMWAEGLVAGIRQARPEQRSPKGKEESRLPFTTDAGSTPAMGKDPNLSSGHRANSLHCPLSR
jgi:hypothetical protein